MLMLALAPAARAANTLALALNQIAACAAKFVQVAPDLTAHENLKQAAVKPTKRRFRPHFVDGTAPEAGDKPLDIQNREIVSEYGYALLDGSIREFRKPVSVDGRRLADSAQALSRLAAGIRGNNYDSKRALLENFEKLGLIGTVTDFGQLLLLFSAASQNNYEFTLGEQMLVDATRALSISYRQTDGNPSMTILKNGKAARQKVQGEILVRVSDYVPVRVNLSAVTEDEKNPTREEAQVDYVMSEFGVVVPAAVMHREFHSTRWSSENSFTYSEFRRFGSTSLIRFPDPTDNVR